MNFLLSIFVATSLWFFYKCGLEEGLKWIRVFHSTRSAVEEILGKPIEEGGRARYKTADALIYVLYSIGQCSRPGTYHGGFDIPSDTVLRYAVVPTNGLKIKDLMVEMNLYTRIEDRHQPQTSLREF